MIRKVRGRSRKAVRGVPSASIRTAPGTRRDVRGLFVELNFEIQTARSLRISLLSSLTWKKPSMRFFEKIGTSVHVPDGDHVLSWPRVSASCDYQRPVRFEDVMTIQLGIDHIGDSSVKFRCRFNRDGRRIAEGSITIVCCELRAGKSPQKRAIPDAIRSQLQKFLWQDSEES